MVQKELPRESSPQRELKTAGLKATGPRMKILQLFQGAQERGVRHLSAEEVYRMLLDDGEDMGLATVYRVLMQFEAAGLLERHRFGADRASFELSDRDHHDHLVCQRCGKVIEFADPAIEARQVEVARMHGFEISGHTLELYGICSGCLAQRAGKG